jgi:hypothetical protein
MRINYGLMSRLVGDAAAARPSRRAVSVFLSFAARLAARRPRQAREARLAASPALVRALGEHLRSPTAGKGGRRMRLVVH